MTEESRPQEETTLEETKFKNVARVHAYLQENGWDISDRGVRDHVKLNKLRSEPTGGFTKKAVDAYAKAHLSSTDTSKKVPKKADNAYIDKAISEARESKAKASLREIELAEREGKILDREETIREIQALLVSIRSRLLQLENTWSPEFAAMTDQILIKERIAADHRHVLSELSNYVPGEKKEDEQGIDAAAEGPFDSLKDSSRALHPSDGRGEKAAQGPLFSLTSKNNTPVAEAPTP